MTALKRNPKVRIQLDLTDKQAEMFDALVEQCDFSSRKELFNAAVSLFSLAAVEAGKANQVAFFDEENDVVRKVVIPPLEHLYNEAIAERHKNEKPEEKLRLKVVPSAAKLEPAI